MIQDLITYLIDFDSFNDPGFLSSLSLTQRSEIEVYFNSSLLWKSFFFLDIFWI